MKTYFDIIRDVSNLRWSIVDPDPASFSEVQKAVKLAINQAHAFIWSLDDFPFKMKKDVFKISQDQSALLAPKGSVTHVWLDNSDRYLKKISSEDADFLSAATLGKPDRFWIEYGDKGAEIHIYPTPATDMSLSVRYISNCKAFSHEKEPKTNLEMMDDYLNLPEDPILEEMYLHCLNTKSMEYLIADQNDENYLPYQKEFQEAYRSLLRFVNAQKNPCLVI